MRHFGTILMLMSLLLDCNLSAQQTDTTSVPNLIRYSGTLTHVQGTALASPTTVGVTFAIYKQQDGGAAVWQETQNVTPDLSGQYNVILGSTTATGLPDDLFSQQEQRWLGVQVQGEAEQSRLMLVSVPYAFKAHEAETLGGLPASAFLKAPRTDASGSTGTDTVTAVNALSAAGNASINPKGERTASRTNTICAAVTANASANYVPLFDLTVCNLVNSTIYQLGSNVGIGTKLPSTALEVAGAISADEWYDTVFQQPFLSIGWPASRVLPNNQNTWLGLSAGGQGTINGSDSGTENTFVGYQAGLSNTGPLSVGSSEGSSNSFFGASAGEANTTGQLNAFFGDLAGKSNTTGVFNAVFGALAGLFNTGPTPTNPLAGSFNSFFGASAGHTNTTGYYNAFFGYRAGYGTSTGNSNTCIGYQTCYGNDATNNTIVGRSTGFYNNGSNNTFLGVVAGYYNTADGNTFVGYHAGQCPTCTVATPATGKQNVFLGESAGLNNVIGNANTFTGSGAGWQHIDGDQNTFSGTSAGFNDYHGAANTFIGASAGQTNGSGQRNTYIGVAAGLNAAGSDNIYAGYAAGWSGNVIPQNTGDRNTFMGQYAGSRNTMGSENAFFGYLAGISNTAGDYNVDISNPGAAGDSRTIRIGNSNLHTALTYVAGIYGTPITNAPLSVVIGADGHLGTASTSGGISGTCRAPGGFFLTKWLTSTSVQCSSITELPNTFVGIGPNETNPGRQLQVRGNIDIPVADGTAHYQIRGTTVLSIDPDMNNSDNLFVGVGAGMNNTGRQNTFAGQDAGVANTDGTSNTFIGGAAGTANDHGSNNTCVGLGACSAIKGTGKDDNTMIGAGAGDLNSGHDNTFLGEIAGVNNHTGNENIYIGNRGFKALSSESNVIRIGSQDPLIVPRHLNTYIAGTWHSSIVHPNEPVCIDATGKLFSVATGCDTGSSRRFKDQIADMGDSSNKLFQLRPVTFLYKPDSDDGFRHLQYGLIAEEVANVYPEMVLYDTEGRPSALKYQMLAPMLLNELQKEHAVVMSQQEELQTQVREIKAQQREIDGLRQQLELQNASLQERLSNLESYILRSR